MVDPSAPDLPEQHVTPQAKPPEGPVPPAHDNPEVAHEYSDVNTSAIIKFGVGFVIFAVLAHFVLAWLFDVLAARTDREHGKLSPLAKQERVPLPKGLDRIPEPRLQKDDVEEMKQLRAYEQRRLTTYGWVDDKKGVVRIPIDRAIELLTDPKGARSKELLVRPQAKKGGP
ncbi:MAG: hypothetical protein L0Z62_24310 [Gemmataceae bacterium]|nr:hypothetical protein [Gemmataceae bacterium]